MGAKQDRARQYRRIDVSIHAPVMGAKQNYHNKYGADHVSIHAPVMGAKVSLQVTSASGPFQSTHP